MSEKLRIISPKIGHGNPFTALAIENLAEGEVNLFGGWVVVIGASSSGSNRSSAFIRWLY